MDWLSDFASRIQEKLEIGTREAFAYLDQFLARQSNTLGRFSALTKDRTRFSVLAVVTLLVTCSVLFVPKSSATLSSFYPSTCTGGWLNPQNATLVQTLEDGQSANAYTDKNSAVLNGTHSDIVCANFAGSIPTGTTPKTFNVKLHWSIDDGSVSHTEVANTTDTTTSSDTSSLSPSPSAPDAVPAPDATPDTTPDTTPVPAETPVATPSPADVPAQENVSAPETVPTPTPEAVPAPEAISTPAPDTAPASTAEATPTVATALKRAVMSLDALATDALSAGDTTMFHSTNDIFAVRYSVDGENWTDIGTVNAANWQTANFAISGSDVSNWSDFSKLHLGLFSLSSDTTQPAVYLDAMEVSVDYTEDTPSLVVPTVKVTDPSIEIVAPQKDNFTLDEAPVFSVTNPNLSTNQIANLVHEEKAVVISDNLGVFSETATQAETSNNQSTTDTNTNTTTSATTDVNTGTTTDSSSTLVAPAQQSTTTTDTTTQETKTESTTPAPTPTATPEQTPAPEATPAPTTDSAPTPTPASAPEQAPASETTSTPDSSLGASAIGALGSNGNGAKNTQPIRLVDIKHAIASATLRFYSTMTRIARYSFANALLALAGDTASPSPIDAVVLDAAGNQTTIAVTVQHVTVDGVAQDQVVVEKPDNMFHPGKYTLQVTLHTPEVNIVSEQDFSWGVLAVNVDRSIYHTGDTAYVQMGVIDDLGHTICDADMSLVVVSPAGVSSFYSTADTTIIREPQCGPDNYILVPDYYAHIPVGTELGTYHLTLTANTKNGIRTVYDTFDVQSEIKFDIVRSGPTRVYPAGKYPSVMKITSPVDWSGTVVEKVPSAFYVEQLKDVLPYTTIKTVGNDSIITWDVSLVANETTSIGYAFVPPPISPEFYLLGPLSLYTSGDDPATATPVFQEIRRWQIADDAACEAVASGNWNSASTWTNCGGGVPSAIAPDTVIIGSGLSTGNCPISLHCIVKLNVNTAVVGTVTINSGSTLKTGNSSGTPTDYNLNTGRLVINTGGTLDATTVASGSTITLSGNVAPLYYNAGTFTQSTSTLTLSGSNGGAYIDVFGGTSGTLTFYNLTISSGFYCSSNDIVVQDTMLFSSGGTPRYIARSGTSRIGGVDTSSHCWTATTTGTYASTSYLAAGGPSVDGVPHNVTAGKIELGSNSQVYFDAPGSTITLTGGPNGNSSPLFNQGNSSLFDPADGGAGLANFVITAGPSSGTGTSVGSPILVFASVGGALSLNYPIKTGSITFSPVLAATNTYYQFAVKPAKITGDFTMNPTGTGTLNFTLTSTPTALFNIDSASPHTLYVGGTATALSIFDTSTNLLTNSTTSTATNLTVDVELGGTFNENKGTSQTIPNVKVGITTAGGTFNCNATPVPITGTLTVGGGGGGTFNINTSTGATIATATINNGGTFNSNTSTSVPITALNVNNGGTFNANSATLVTITTPTVASGGIFNGNSASTININGIFTNNSGGTINPGTSTIFFNAAGAGASRPFKNSGTFNVGSSCTSTVKYTGTGSATDLESNVASYCNLTIAAVSTTYSLNGALTVDPLGTLTIQNGTLDTTASHYNISAGKIVISIGGTAVLTANTTTQITLTGTSGTLFTKGGAGTFNANSSTVVVNTDNSVTLTNATPITFFNLSLSPTITTSPTYTLASSAALTINGDFTVNPTASTAQTLTVKMNSAITVAATKTTLIKGTTSGLSVLNTTGVTVSNNALSTGLLDIESGGSLTANASAITVTGALTGGSVGATGTLFTNNGTFTPGTSTVTFTGANTTGLLTSGTFVSGSTTNNFYNLTLNNTTATYTLGSAIEVTGATGITISNSTFDTSTNQCTASTSCNITASSITIANSSTAAFTARASLIKLNGIGTPATLFTDNRSLGAGFTAGTSTVQVTTPSGVARLTAGTTGLVFHNITIGDTGISATVVYAGTSFTMDSTGTFYVKKGVFSQDGTNVITGGGGTSVLQMDSGTLYCIGGSNGTNTVGANCIDSGTNTTSVTALAWPNFGSYSLNANSTIAYLMNVATTISASPTYGNLSLTPVIATSAKTYTLGGAMTINGNFTIQPTGAAFLLTVNAGGNITASGTTAIGGTTATGTLFLRPASTTYNLTTNALTTTSGGTLNGGTGGTASVITVTTNVTNGGTITTGNSAITLGGNWTNTGTFTAGVSSTVTMNSGTTATVSGATTFTTLIIAPGVGVSKEVDFTAGQTFTVSTAFTVTGHSGNLVKLFSTDHSTPTQWKILSNSSNNVTYADVQDAGCGTGMTAMITATNTTNDGNNNSACWTFNVPYLNFNLSSNSVDFGTLSLLTPRYATSSAGGSGLSTIAQTISVSSSGTGGYNLYVQGATPTNGSYSMHPIGCANLDWTSFPTTSDEFGIRLETTGPGKVAGDLSLSAAFPLQCDYGGSGATGFAYYGVSSPSLVGAYLGSGSSTTTAYFTTYNIRYIAYSTGSTVTGSYTTSLTYTVVGNF